MGIQNDLVHAQRLIKAKKYQQAQKILMNIDHPTADKWLVRLDSLTEYSSDEGRPWLITGVLLGALGFFLPWFSMLFILNGFDFMFDNNIQATPPKIIAASYAIALIFIVIMRVAGVKWSGIGAIGMAPFVIYLTGLSINVVVTLNTIFDNPIPADYLEAAIELGWVQVLGAGFWMGAFSIGMLLYSAYLALKD